MHRHLGTSESEYQITPALNLCGAGDAAIREVI